jgi:hypothetical protein
MHGRVKAYLLQSIRDRALLCNVARVKWRVVVALHDVEYGHIVASLQELLDDVSADEAASADDEIRVLL